MALDRLTIWIMKQDDGSYIAKNYNDTFYGISAHGETRLQALRAFCKALQREIEMEDLEK